MNTLMKAGLGLTLLAGAVGVAHHVHSAEPAAALAADLVIPASLEKEIREMARSHAAPGQNPVEAEAAVMKIVREHLSQIAKDPAQAEHVQQMMARAASGDRDAREQVHSHLISLVQGSH